MKSQQFKLLLAITYLLCTANSYILFCGSSGYGKTTAFNYLTGAQMPTANSPESVTQQFNQAQYKNVDIFDTVGSSNNYGDENKSKYTGDTDSIVDICSIASKNDKITSLVYFIKASGTRVDDIHTQQITNLGKVFPGVPMYIQNSFYNEKLDCHDNTKKFIEEISTIEGINVQGYSCFDPKEQTEQFKSFYDDVIAKNSPQATPNAREGCQSIISSDPKYEQTLKKRQDCEGYSNTLKDTQTQLLKYDENFCKISSEQRVQSCLNEFGSFEKSCKVKKQYKCGENNYVIASTAKICDEETIDSQCQQTLANGKMECLKIANLTNFEDCKIQMDRNKEMLQKRIQDLMNNLKTCPMILQEIKI